MFFHFKYYLDKIHWCNHFDVDNEDLYFFQANVSRPLSNTFIYINGTEILKLWKPQILQDNSVINV